MRDVVDEFFLRTINRLNEKDVRRVILLDQIKGQLPALQVQLKEAGESL